MWHCIFAVVESWGDLLNYIIIISSSMVCSPQYLKTKNKQTKNTKFCGLETVALQSHGRRLGLI